MPEGIGGVIQLEVICTKPPPKSLFNSLLARGRIANALEVHPEIVQVAQ